MDDSQSSMPANAAGLSMLDKLEQLAPALDGYPVNQLLDVFMSAEQRDHSQAQHLVTRCIAHWIATLEGDLRAFPDMPDDALLKLQARQQNARDALFALQGELARLDVARRDRSRPS